MSVYLIRAKGNNTKYEKYLQSLMKEPFNGKHREVLDIEVIKKRNLLDIRNMDNIIDKCHKIIKNKKTSRAEKQSARQRLSMVQPVYASATI